MAKVIETEWGFSSAGRAPALQAGGRRFDPVNLHQTLGGEQKQARTHIQAGEALVLAFADKQFFKNLEEVKKVIHAEAGTGRPVFVDA